MKLFSYLLVACVGLGLLACSTENDPVATDNGTTKSVALKLAGLSSATKAIEPGTTSPSSEAIVLKDLRVVFYNSTSHSIYRITDFSPASPADWTALTDPTADGYIFHDLDPNVTSVLVVGNWQGGKDFTWTNETTIKNSPLLALEENQSVPDLQPTPVNSTKNYVTLFGDVATLTPGATFTDNTHPTGANITKYSASVTIAPLVARFEIGNIQCTDLGTSYSRFDLEAIGLIDMSLTSTVSPRTLSQRLLIDTNILPPGWGGSVGANQYIFGTAPELAWAYNAISPEVRISSSSTIYNPDGTTAAPNGTKKFVYNFFPDVDDGDPLTTDGFPNIKLLLNEVTNIYGGTSGFNFVVTARFTSDAAHLIPAMPQAGYIYKVDLAFKEENIGPWNPDNFICVIVDVTVTPWTIVPLYPVFK